MNGDEISYEERILDNLRDAVEEYSPQMPPPIITLWQPVSFYLVSLLDIGTCIVKNVGLRLRGQRDHAT